MTAGEQLDTELDGIRTDIEERFGNFAARINELRTDLSRVTERVAALETTEPGPPPPPPPPPDPEPTEPPSGTFPTLADFEGYPVRGPIQWGTGEIVEGVIVRSDGQHGFRDVGQEGILRDCLVDVTGADGGKPHDGMRIDGCYFIVDVSGGGHLDILQMQGSTGWDIYDTVLHYEGGPSSNVTAHLFVQNRLGGNRGFTDVTGHIDGLRLIGEGSPWGHDLRFAASDGYTQDITLLNVEWVNLPNSKIICSAGTTLRVDGTVPDSRIRANGATVVRV